jgi:hypothetical protein
MLWKQYAYIHAQGRS